MTITQNARLAKVAAATSLLVLAVLTLPTRAQAANTLSVQGRVVAIVKGKSSELAASLRLPRTVSGFE